MDVTFETVLEEKNRWEILRELKILINGKDTCLRVIAQTEDGKCHGYIKFNADPLEGRLSYKESIPILEFDVKGTIAHAKTHLIGKMPDIIDAVREPLMDALGDLVIGVTIMNRYKKYRETHP